MSSRDYWRRKNRERTDKRRAYLNGERHYVTVYPELARRPWR